MKKKWISKLRQDERGLSTMEYAVLFVIIVVGAIALWSKLGSTLATNVDKGGKTFETTMQKHQK